MTDEEYMREALVEARKAYDMGEIPIGAVLVHEGKIISRHHNRREIDMMRRLMQRSLSSVRRMLCLKGGG